MGVFPPRAVRSGQVKLISYKQLEIKKLIPALQVAIRPTFRNLTNKDGGEGRMLRIRKTLTELIKEERIEGTVARAHEVQGYAERLIGEAVRYGDKHIPTMEIANFYMLEKQLIHKLFKVLVPRFANHKESFTRIYNVSQSYPNYCRETSVIEIKGNPYPRLETKKIPTHNWINNILLEEVRKDFRATKV